MLFRRVVALLLVAGSAGTAAGAPEAQDSETPYPGITYTVWLDEALPARIHVVAVDLTASSIDLVATAEDQRGKKPSAFAATAGAVLAVNGDYFSPNGFVPAGLARGQSQTWAGSSDDETSGFIRFHRDVARTQLRISPPSDLVDDVPEQTVGVISGHPMLVQGGAALSAFDCKDDIAMPCEPAPRTAVAMSPDENTLYVIVVDGWQAESLGMTARQLGVFIAGKLDAHEGLLLDGGSASAMWLAGELVSSPSDGVERPVANHLAVRYGELPTGVIQGHVTERSVGGTRIAGATVTIDDGREKTYDGDNLWTFTATPRWTCVTASKTGYHPATECRQVPSADQIYSSIALFPNSDFIDAGPGAPDGAPPPDGGLEQPLADGGAAGATDAGSDRGIENSTCGCGSAGDGGMSVLGFLLVIGLAGLRRSPRTR
ncbi:MAG TPA: phosphodiester glycosidase family protein [Kofleriaceae bacterium]|nr:phosphodiester glycosidase family protein [Kofleriaceae bacterium]